MSDLKEICLFDIALNSCLWANLDSSERMLISPHSRSSPRGIFNTGNLGYINPERVTRFMPYKKNRIISGSPDLSVKIDFEEDWRVGLAGTYYFHAHLEKDKSTPVLSGPIFPTDIAGNKIDPRFVVEDNSGKIIPLTEERIRRKIYEGRKIVAKGGIEYFNVVEKLAKVGGFDFSKQIEQARQLNDRAELSRYSSPENLVPVLNELDRFIPTMQFDTKDEDLLNPSYEVLDEFLEMVGRVKFPNQMLKTRAVNILREYQKSISSQRDEQEGDLGVLEQKLKDTDALINSL
jgi:hypothetical protein